MEVQSKPSIDGVESGVELGTAVLIIRHKDGTEKRVLSKITRRVVRVSKPE